MTKPELVDLLIDSRLHTKARKLLEMVYVHGMSQSEAARVLDITRQAANAYVARFRKLLGGNLWFGF